MLFIVLYNGISRPTRIIHYFCYFPTCCKSSLVAIVFADLFSLMQCLGSDRSLMSPGDGVDNDCDSLIDEEPGIDGIDNDNDGLIDEDASS